MAAVVVVVVLVVSTVWSPRLNLDRGVKNTARSAEVEPSPDLAQSAVSG